MPATEVGKLQRVPGVRDVARYRAGFLDIADRRVLVFGPPADAAAPVPVAQVRAGDRRRAGSAHARRRLGDGVARAGR